MTIRWFLGPVLFLALAAMMVSVAVVAEESQAPAAGQSPSAAAQEAKDRDYFSDNELMTQDGEVVRFFTDVIKDQVVLINFMFTNCGSACPLQTRSLVQVAGLLGDEVGRSVRFVSISIDPERDTPDAMKAFAIKHGADQAGWLFLTGEPVKVNQVVKKLGQYSPDVEAHSTLLLAGNVKDRHWVKIPPNLPPQGIAERLRGLLGMGLTGAGG